MHNRVGVAVALCLEKVVCGKKQIFVYLIRELQSKPGFEKSAQALSIPIETMEDEDGETIECAFKRAVSEELCKKPEDPRETAELASFEVTPVAVLNSRYGSAHLGVMQVPEKLMSFRATPGKPEEVSGAGWFSLKTIEDMLRSDTDVKGADAPKELRPEMGVILPALKAHFSSKKGVRVGAFASGERPLSVLKRIPMNKKVKACV